MTTLFVHNRETKDCTLLAYGKIGTTAVVGDKAAWVDVELTDGQKLYRLCFTSADVTALAEAIKAERKFRREQRARIRALRDAA
jgi:hypothetical protein